MLSNKETICPDNLLNVAHKKKGVPAAIVNAGMPLPMLSTMDAVNENLPNQKKLSGYSPKIMADYYIDDKVLGFGDMLSQKNTLKFLEVIDA